MRIIKKMVALGMGLTMVGATVMGASAAYTLSDYPGPFVKNGMPNNVAVIVGDKSDPSDVVGMGDIVADLQKRSVTEVAVAGSAARVRLVGDSVEIGTPTDLLELEESMGSVRPTLQEGDLALLKGGSITTPRKVTKFNQYLKFNDTANFASNLVRFDEDEFNQVGDFFYTRDGDNLFEWTLEFEEGFVSRATQKASGISYNLKDFLDRDIQILGNKYTVVDATVDNSTARIAQVTLMGGEEYLEVGEGDQKTVTLASTGSEVNVEVVVISETSSEVLLRVNGQELPRLRRGEMEPLADGKFIGVRDIIATGKDTQSSVVRLFVGANKIIFKDTNSADNLFNDGGLTSNNELVEDGSVLIRTSTGSSGVQEDGDVTISHIKYRLRADALVGDLWVPKGHGVREYLDEPEGLLTPNWDIRYEGLMDTGTTMIKITPSGNEEYKLEFENQEGLKYKIPWITARSATGKGAQEIRAGEVSGGNQRNLIFQEDHNEADYRIKKLDYFVVSPSTNRANVTMLNGTGAAGINSEISIFGGKNWTGVRDVCNNNASHPFLSAPSDDSGETHVLQYDSIDVASTTLTFTDLATGTKQVVYDIVTLGGTLIVGGNTYDVNSSNITDGGISVDLNADGRHDGNFTTVFTAGGLLLALGHDNPANGTAAGSAFAGMGTGFPMWYLVGTVLRDQFDEATDEMSFCFVATAPGSNRIGLNRTDFKVTGWDNASLLTLTSEPEIAQALDRYGTKYEMFDPLSTASEEVTIEFPLSQRGVQVFVTAGKVEATSAGSSKSQQVNPLPVGTSKLASEVSDVKQFNAVVVGGPCANPIAASLMGNPDPCHESIPENSALLKLYEHSNGNVALLVAGRTSLNTRQASRALSGKLPDASEAKVTGTSLSDVSVKAV